MKGFTLLSLAVFVGLICGGAAQGNTSALDALVQRQLPFHADSFVFHLEEEVQVNVRTHSALDTFTLFDGSDGKVNIECSTKSACSRGLYTYFPQGVM
jgi:alpha-N-acetylglucosaminidase